MIRRRLVAFAAGISLVAGLVGVAASPANAAPEASAPVTTAVQPAKPARQLDVPPAPDAKRDKKQKGVTPSKGGKGIAPLSDEITTKAACASPCFSYASARRNVPTAPFVAASTGLRVVKPALQAGDFHSLAEMSVQKGNDIIEVGITVDPGVNSGSSDPHLFVSGWYDNGGVRTWCGSYNGGCGYTDYGGNPVNAGANVIGNLNSQPQTFVQYWAGNWWISYNGGWIGYFPADMAHGRTSFTDATVVQTFGEVATTRLPSCTDMGNGNFPSASGSYPSFGADFYNLNTSGVTGGWTGVPYTNTIITDPSKWNLMIIGTSSARYGGPGAAAGTCP